jgi:hypothetical protein
VDGVPNPSVYREVQRAERVARQLASKTFDQMAGELFDQMAGELKA